MKDFLLNKVFVTSLGKKEGHWQFAGQDVKGTLHDYAVEDRNFTSDCKWIFQIRVPYDFEISKYVEVKPLMNPQKKCWPKIDRMSINLSVATKPNYEGMMYAKIYLADVTRCKNRIGIRREQRSLLPSYIQLLKIRVKDTVTTTSGTDGNSLVTIVGANRHNDMIKIFLATRAWILYNKFQL